MFYHANYIFKAEATLSAPGLPLTPNTFLTQNPEVVYHFSPGTEFSMKTDVSRLDTKNSNIYALLFSYKAGELKRFVARSLNTYDFT